MSRPQLKTQNTPIQTPPEWAPQKAMWTAWPSSTDLWLEDLRSARAEAAAMIKVLAKGTKVKVLACGEEAAASAQHALTGSAEIIPATFGDIWLRDTGPIFAFQNGEPVALRFRNNGWGGKYHFPDDDKIGDFIAQQAHVPVKKFDIVLEGGSLENDGEGTILTTHECLLNPNRNPGMTQGQIEEILREALGARKILWLEGGLLNDHTDGHIDNIARFVAPGRVVCQVPSGKDDPNTETLNKIAADLSGMTDAAGRKLDVIRIPGPGLVRDDEGTPLAASHMNFIIGNKSVALPTYGTASAAGAVAELQNLFPSRAVTGLPSFHILRNGGGSFHCMTQQEPTS